jgi:hypothetical protein
VVLLDQAHFNTHTLEGRYRPLARVARRDGYQIKTLTGPISERSLARARILVIASALNERNRRREAPARTDWSLPTPSAFSAAEISVVREWVRAGGSLLVLADHMPFAGAAAALVAEYGVRFENTFAMDESRERELGDASQAIAHATVFRRSDGTLADHPISNGRDASERVDAVATFAGHAFRADAAFSPLLVLGPSTVALAPRVAWQFPPDTPRSSASGWLQAATRRFGQGRVAIFGEAGLFGVQNTGTKSGEPVGMNAPEAEQNPQFLLNLLHWLSGILDAP